MQDRAETWARGIVMDGGHLERNVAASVGYVRASYRTFLNAFRAETGMSPTDYQAIASARAQMRARRDRMAAELRSA